MNKYQFIRRGKIVFWKIFFSFIKFFFRSSFAHTMIILSSSTYIDSRIFISSFEKKNFILIECWFNRLQFYIWHLHSIFSYFIFISFHIISFHFISIFNLEFNKWKFLFDFIHIWITMHIISFDSINRKIWIIPVESLKLIYFKRKINK